MMNKNEKRQCCFCGLTIIDTEHEPVKVAVYFKDASSQYQWTHIDCLGQRLHNSVPWLSLKDREEINK